MGHNMASPAGAGEGRVSLVIFGPAGIFADMRTTSSFEIFPNEPSERSLAKARRFRQEGRVRESEQEYRRVMDRQPGLRASWTECFDLLRRSGQAEQALALAADAERTFSKEAFPIALRGAALIEQKRFPEALEALEVAVDRDPGLALTWHELGYAAHRIGEGSRALAALDRAFALEPHTETLTLRGRILRESGEFYAATVAFEAAMHSATHDGQRAEIQREVYVTQRLGDFAPRRPNELTRAERWFAEHGTVVLAAVDGDGGPPPTSGELLQAFVTLARDRDWSFGQVIGVGQDALWTTMADEFGLAVDSPDQVNGERVPLILAERPPKDDLQWGSLVESVRDGGRGLIFVLWHPADETSHADVVGGLEENGDPLPFRIDSADALVMAQHPRATVADRDVVSPGPTP